MMRNPVQTISTLIDKQKIAFIGSVDVEGFPNMKAMLTPRKREGIKVLYFTTNTSSKRVAQYRAAFVFDKNGVEEYFFIFPFPTIRPDASHKNFSNPDFL
jgi:general stress protein 26